MKLEDQVVSLELAKQMKEAGVPQDSCMHWKLNGTKFDLVSAYYLFDKNLHGDNRVYSAYTVAELGEMLNKPSWLKCHTEYKHIDYMKNIIDVWHCYHDEHKSKLGGVTESRSKTEADARAKMALYLKKEGLLKASKSEKGE